MSSTGAVISCAQRVDFVAIADLINRAFSIERPYIEEQPESERSVANVIDDGGVCFVAKDSHGLIGCVFLDPKLFIISKLAVEFSRREQGYGSKLMTEAENYGKTSG